MVRCLEGFFLDSLIVPKNYDNKLTVRETESAIKLLRTFFENSLSDSLNLNRVSAPLFVKPETGLNDNLNDVERPVAFDILEQGIVVEIVHSLAKWKRYALHKYGFSIGEGIYTNMNAIRRDEYTDNLHSLYVDQWDWERVITKEDRNEGVLHDVVKNIYCSIKATEKFVCEKYPALVPYLPEEITFITTQQMEDEKPELTPKQREDYFAKKYGAIFIQCIGDVLNSGEKHDGRAPDYDDWSLNGDIVIYYPVLDRAVELSSMGIRVDSIAIKEQLEKANKLDKASLPFQADVINEVLPYTIGGGIGQSRLCMVLLQKAHIGEVQASVWPVEMENVCSKGNINLL